MAARPPLPARVPAPTMGSVDAEALRRAFERIDATLSRPTELLIRGGAALLALGHQDRSTVDIPVLPDSRFVEADLRAACTAAGLGWNPHDKDFPEGDYVEVVPANTLVLPVPNADYDVVFRGTKLTVRTPPAADLVIGKLKRLEPEDLSDITYLVGHFGVDEAALRAAFDRLPERFRRDGVLLDNLRYVCEDLWGPRT